MRRVSTDTVRWWPQERGGFALADTAQEFREGSAIGWVVARGANAAAAVRMLVDLGAVLTPACATMRAPVHGLVLTVGAHRDSAVLALEELLAVTLTTRERGVKTMRL